MLPAPMDARPATLACPSGSPDLTVAEIGDAPHLVHPALGVGDAFAGYRLEELIGAGGMGVVFRARDLFLERDVALKVIAPERAASPKARELFLRECRLAARIEHPHVLPVYGAGEGLHGSLYMVTRYVAGRSLRDLIDHDGPLSPECARRIGRQLRRALAAIHAGGLVHRDVTPANILVADIDGREHAFLTDFGIAALDGVAPIGTFSGTTGELGGAPPAPGCDFEALNAVLAGEHGVHSPRAVLPLRRALIDHRRPVAR